MLKLLLDSLSAHPIEVAAPEAGEHHVVINSLEEYHLKAFLDYKSHEEIVKFVEVLVVERRVEQGEVGVHELEKEQFKDKRLLIGVRVLMVLQLQEDDN